MSRSPNLIAIAGSSRTASMNKKLVRVAAAGASEAGAEVTVLDMADKRLPLLDLDSEEKDGVPGSRAVPEGSVQRERARNQQCGGGIGIEEPMFIQDRGRTE